MTDNEAIAFVEECALSSDLNYVHTKAAEELLELATVLLQHVNKPDKDYTKEIIEEAGHVLLRLAQISKLYGQAPIVASFVQKATYLKHGKEKHAWRNV